MSLGCSGSIRTSSPTRATALAAGSRQALGSHRIPATIIGYGQLLGWARQFPQRRWAIENAPGLGCQLTQWLLAQRRDRPGCAHHRHRAGPGASRGRGRKTDALDAAAAAGITAMQGDAEPLQPEDATMLLAVLEERRNHLVAQRTPASTNSMPCWASSSPAVPHLGCGPTRPPRCSARSTR